MEYLYLALAVFLVADGECVVNSSLDNSNDTNRDMYVINAMVYQVGIITNSTDDLDRNATTGSQEALTLYQTNGSSLDLSEIPTPLLTNITGKSMVALASQRDKRSKPGSDDGPKNIKSRETFEREMPSGHQERTYTTKTPNANGSDYFISINRLVTRNTDNQTAIKEDPVKVTSGTSVIPQAAGVHSLGIPPLLTFNNNLSEIPVPIPNSSIVQYSTINTLFKPSNKTE